MEESKELLSTDTICNRVYTIRGQQVMLDYDLAEIYGYEVKRLNEQVKRNKNRFPEDFMFQLEESELDILKSQNATSSWGGKGSYLMPSLNKEYTCLQQFCVAT